MPQVPIIQGRSVQENALQGGEFSTPDVSSGLRSLSSGLGAVANMAEKVVVDQQTQQAYATETDIKSAWLAKDAELRKVYRGANVAGYQEEVAKFWDDAQSTATADLSAFGKRIVGQSLGVARVHALHSSTQYFAGEVERAQDESFQASKTVEIQRGLTDGRPEAIAASADILRQRNAQQGALKGWTTEQLQAANLRDTSDLYGANIARLASTDPTAAKAEFDAHRDDIDAHRHGVIEHTLGAELQNQTARQTAASLATKPLADQLEEVSKINDPNLREKTLQAVRENHGMLKAAQQQRESDAADKAWQGVAQGQRVPEVTLASMDGRARVQLQDYLRQRAEHLATQGNAAPKTDPAVHADLWSALVSDPQTFAKMDLRPFGMKLSPSDLEQLSQQQIKLRSEKTAHEVVGVGAQIEAVADATGLKDPKVKGQFQSYTFGQLAAAQEAKGRALTLDERQKVIDAAVLQQKGTGGWFSADKRAFEVAADAKPKTADPQAAPVRVTSPAQAKALPPGTRFTTPDGREFTR